MTIPFSNVVNIVYMPIDANEFETALIDGKTTVFLRLKNIEGIDLTKFIRMEKSDGSLVYQTKNGDSTYDINLICTKEEDGSFVYLFNATKPICVQKDDKSLVYLKIPNPCNHKPLIAYVEACVAKLAHDLLLPRGVVVPEYEVIELPLELTSGLSKTPCCLIEALETFESFGKTGNDFAADSKKVKMDRFSEEQMNDRTRKLGILFSKEFAAFSAVTQFIGNNDPHQENFGLMTIAGKSVLAAIDFDMAPTDFLSKFEVFGPYNAEEFTPDNLYHAGEGGRYTPNNIDFCNFPVPRDAGRCATPDRWITEWCTGFDVGLMASGQADEFHDESDEMFRNLAKLSDLFFERTFERAISKTVLDNNPELATLIAALVGRFKDYTSTLKSAFERHEAQKEAAKSTRLAALAPQRLSISDTPSSLLSGSMFQPPEGALECQKTSGGSPGMPEEWPYSPPCVVQQVAN